MRHFHDPQYCVVERFGIGTEFDHVVTWDVLNVYFEEGLVDGLAPLALFAFALLDLLVRDLECLAHLAHHLNRKVEVAPHDEQIVKFDEFDELFEVRRLGS